MRWSFWFVSVPIYLFMAGWRLAVAFLFIMMLAMVAISMMITFRALAS